MSNHSDHNVDAVAKPAYMHFKNNSGQQKNCFFHNALTSGQNKKEQKTWQIYLFFQFILFFADLRHTGWYSSVFLARFLYRTFMLESTTHKLLITHYLIVAFEVIQDTRV